MKILSAQQIREVDRLSTERFGIPGILLMENAGMRVVEAILDVFEEIDPLTIAVLCGKGNNGGDGFVVARQLIQKGCFPFVFLFGEEDEVRGDARVNLDILKAIGAPPTIIRSEDDWEQEKLEILDADLIVDALLGTGLTRPATGLYASVIDSLDDDFSKATILSIDVPSGLPADNAEPIGPVVQADMTVTFTALKPCLVLPPAHRYAGDIIVAEIGNPAELLEGDHLKLSLVTEDSFPGARHRRAEASNKGDFGKVLIVGGSRGKSGAAAMAGQAALRSGTGLVTVATAGAVLPMIAASMPELMTEALEETRDGTIARQSISKLIEGKTVLAIGPGLTTQHETRDFVRTVLRETIIPIVIDADGLNALVGGLDCLRGGAVLTPHPGEMARLIGKDVDYVLENRLRVATDFATGQGVYLVLKGFRTLIATPDGAIFINPTGNPGMATGGTGDILTGMIAGMLAQEHLGSFVERLCLAVYLHGLAGDLAAKEVGEETMVATDILKYIGAAWKKLHDESD